MPIEIKELIIRATVVENTLSGNSKTNSADEVNISQQEQIITACVEQVLTILERSKER